MCLSSFYWNIQRNGGHLHHPARRIYPNHLYFWFNWLLAMFFLLWHNWRGWYTECYHRLAQLFQLLFYLLIALLLCRVDLIQDVLRGHSNLTDDELNFFLTQGVHHRMFSWLILLFLLVWHNLLFSLVLGRILLLLCLLFFTLTSFFYTLIFIKFLFFILVLLLKVWTMNFLSIHLFLRLLLCRYRWGKILVIYKDLPLVSPFCNFLFYLVIFYIEI